MIFTQEMLLVALGLGIYDTEQFHVNCFSKEILSLRIRQTQDDIWPDLPRKQILLLLL